MRFTRAIVAILCTAAASAFADSRINAEIRGVLAGDFRFAPSELADLERGRIVKHTLDASAPGEIAVAGAVRVHAEKTRLLARVRDITRFKRGPDVVEIGRFSDPPVMEDLAGLTVTKDDFDPRSCRLGDCGIRLPADAIRRIGRELDPRAIDLQSRAGALFKQILLDSVRAYVSGDPGRILEYDDDETPIRPADEFAGLLKGMTAFGDLVPALPDHLLKFPDARVDGAEDFLYWSKEKFGAAPFITVTHVVIVCRTAATCVVATKDVYSSRYIDASLAVTLASDAAGGGAFDLVYANRSRASALKGRLSALRRSIAERRARASLEDTLKSLKIQLEKAR